jgi:hypothetical protein
MKTLKKQYFISDIDMWSSVRGENLHKISYNGVKCFFDGYDFLNDQGKIIFSYHSCYHSTPIQRIRIIKKGIRFKLLSIVENDGIKNYLGKNIKTGELITFSWEQITFI